MTLAPPRKLIVDPLLPDMRAVESGNCKGLPLAIVPAEYIVEIPAAPTRATHQQRPRRLAPLHRLKYTIRNRLRLVHNVHQVIARTLHMPALSLLRIARAEPDAATHQLLAINQPRVYIADLAILDRETVLLATQAIDHLPQMRPQRIRHLSVHTSRTHHQAPRPAKHVPDDSRRRHHARLARAVRSLQRDLRVLLVQSPQHRLLPRIGIA